MFKNRHKCQHSKNVDMTISPERRNSTVFSRLFYFLNCLFFQAFAIFKNILFLFLRFQNSFNFESAS